MTGCSLRRLQERTVPAGTHSPTGPATPYATKKSEPANSLQSANSTQRRYDGCSLRRLQERLGVCASKSS